MFDQLQEAAEAILREEWGIGDVAVLFQRPEQSAFGDSATPIALQISKQVRTSPKEIAKRLSERLSQHDDVQRCDVAGPGYVNVWLTPSALIEELKRTRQACTAKVTRKEAPVIVDYSSPNIAKPLGIHHILSTIIGQCIANLYAHAGYPVVRWNYLGDWGTQFGNLAVAYERWGASKPASLFTLDELLALYVKFHKEADADASLASAGQEAFRRLEANDPSLRAFWSDVVAVTKGSMKLLYQRLSVSFDVDRGESYYEDKMAPIVEEGKKNNVFREGQKGALVVEFSPESGLPTAVVVKGDGSTLYLTRDLALMKDRIENFHPQSILWAVDTAQKLYFQQLFAVVEQLGWELPHLEHMAFGRMRFEDSNMSTRKGNILKLEEVLDEAVQRAAKLIESRGEAIQTDTPGDLAEIIGVGSIVYGMLSQNRISEIVFDWDRMLSFDGNSAPYLQYTHARARSVLRKASVGTEIAAPAAVETLTEHERSLVGALLEFPGVLEEARRAHLPHMLATYLFSLCQQFNAFYNDEPILQAPEPSRTLRLSCTALTATVLKCGAELLTLRVPDRM
jgi:arginyl-tRNA synthetase